MSSATEDLRHDVVSGRAVAMVGTGVSRAATGNSSVASWRGLLESGVTQCCHYDPELDGAWAKRVRREIRSGHVEDLLSAAEKIARQLHGPCGGEYRQWLRETIGQLHATDRRVLNALRDLGIPLATTNYDGLLEEVTGLLPITWRDGPLVIDWLHGKVPGIFHFHGFWLAPETVVLSIRSYQEVIGDHVAQESIRALLATKVFLFVGFGTGLEDPSFVQLRKWMTQIFAGAGTCHYRLALEKERKKVQKEHAPEERIKVVAFGKQYGDLEEFLGGLGSVSVATAAGRLIGRPRIPPQHPCCGRVKLIDQLVDAVLNDGARPIPILGGPALGKTTVVIAVLHDPRVAARYGARRYFVTCGGARSRADVVAKIAQAVGIAHSPYLEDAVLSALGSEPAILALDDTETLWQAGPAEFQGLQDLLATLASVRSLALLAVFRGAQMPLLVDWQQPVQVAPLEACDAREVFLRVAGTDFASDPLLDQLLDAVGCVPYAVMLLGHIAQTEPTNLHGLWNGWQRQRMRLLRGRSTCGDYNLEASFEVSLSAGEVDEAARRLLSVLAMLPEGMSPGDVDQAFPDLGEEACFTLRRAALVFPREPRLRLHGLLREYVREHYPPQDRDLQRAIDYYADLAGREASQFGTKDSQEAVSRFGANLGNIEAIIHAGLNSAQPAKALDAAAALAAFICLTGSGSRECVTMAEPLQGSMSPASRARLVCNHADLETRYGSRQWAHDLYAAACDLFESVGDVDGAADCVKKMADLQRHAGQLQEAAKGYQWALEVQEEHGNLVGQAGCLAGLADIAMVRKDYFGARDQFVEAFRLYQQAENHAGMAYCKMRMGYVALDQKDFTEARSYFKDAMPLASKAYDLLIKASALQGLGEAELACSELDGAEACFQEALPFFQRVDDTFGIGGCLRGLGDVGRGRSSHLLAWQHYLNALQIYRRGPHWPDVAEICRRLASIAPSDGERQSYESQAMQAVSGR